MSQIVTLSDALFTRSAELEMAQIRIAELEAKEKENELTGSQDRTAGGANEHLKPDGDGKTKAARSRGRSVPK